MAKVTVKKSDMLGYAIAVDPGIATFGWSVIEVCRESKDDTVMDLGVLTTVNTTKKRDIFAKDDLQDRLEYLMRSLLIQVDSVKPCMVVCESMSQVSVNASAASKLALVVGGVITLCTLRDLPLITVLPQEVKQALLGERKGSKDDVKAALAKFPIHMSVHAQLALDGISPKKLREHPLDSVGVWLAAQDSTIVRMYRQR